MSTGKDPVDWWNHPEHFVAPAHEGDAPMTSTEKSPCTKWAVERPLMSDDGDKIMIRLGTVSWVGDGYRFTSNVASHRNSRKHHPTFEACLPRWVSYPDGCETRCL